MGHRLSWPIFQTGTAAKRSIGGLIAGPASPWPCSTPSSRTQSRYHPVRPINRKPRIAPGLSEARCLLDAAPAPPLLGQLVRCAVWSAWLNMAFSDAAISVGELAV